MSFLDLLKNRFKVAQDSGRDFMPHIFTFPTDFFTKNSINRFFFCNEFWPHTLYYKNRYEWHHEKNFLLTVETILNPFSKYSTFNEKLLDLFLGWFFALFVELLSWIFHAVKHAINIVLSVLKIPLAVITGVLSLIAFVFFALTPPGWILLYFFSSATCDNIFDSLLKGMTAGLVLPFLILFDTLTELLYIPASLLIGAWLVLKSAVKLVLSPFVGLITSLISFYTWCTVTPPPTVQANARQRLTVQRGLRVAPPQPQHARQPLAIPVAQPVHANPLTQEEVQRRQVEAQRRQAQEEEDQRIAHLLQEEEKDENHHFHPLSFIQRSRDDDHMVLPPIRFLGARSQHNLNSLNVMMQLISMGLQQDNSFHQHGLFAPHAHNRSALNPEQDEKPADSTVLARATVANVKRDVDAAYTLLKTEAEKRARRKAEAAKKKATPLAPLLAREKRKAEAAKAKLAVTNTQRLAAIKYTGEIPEEYCCTHIFMDIMTAPVMFNGRTFEGTALLAHWEKRQEDDQQPDRQLAHLFDQPTPPIYTDPVTRDPLTTECNYGGILRNLKSNIESFVKEQERIAEENNGIWVAPATSTTISRK